MNSRNSSNKIIELYADGGVIGSNPSAIGGTYAYRLIKTDRLTIDRSGTITTLQMGGLITNNQTEMLALLRGFAQLPDDFKGTVYSDSHVSLGRIFLAWKWNNIPAWMHRLYRDQRDRLKYWNEIKYILLDGHPTKDQLIKGIGKRGHPVSIHNVWCDHACQHAGMKLLESLNPIQEATT
jgi:ribonuclease HI